MSQESRVKSQKGQVIIILLLVMVISLAIGLSVVGRSLTEIATSTNSENSARAFSAAESGIEKILYLNSLTPTPAPRGSLTIGTDKLTNNSQATVNWNNNLPLNGTALEYPPFGKESFAQFWLADPKDTPPSLFYNKPDFDIYFGDPDYNYTKDAVSNENYPAIEVRVVNSDNTSILKVFDSSPSNDTRSRFPGCIERGTKDAPLLLLTNSNTTNSQFLCRVTVTGYSVYPVMARVRILFSNITHPVALRPTSSGSLPPQAKIFDSKGTSGNVQRNLQVFQETYFMPQIFDYAVFSLSELRK